MNILYKLIDPIRSKENKKRRYALVLVLLLLCSIASLFVWTNYKSDNLILPPLTEEEQELLGEWKFSSDGPPPRLDYGFTLLPDHKCIKRWYILKTNDIVDENTDLIWWRTGNRLTVRLKRGAGRDVFSIGITKWHQSYPTDYHFDLTPDGPGRYRTNNSQETKDLFKSPYKSGTGEMVLIERKRD